jgi:hypothetical protein
MKKEAKRLLQAFAHKEKTEQFRANLAKLKEAGTVSQEHYDLLVVQYQKTEAELAAEITGLQVAISQEGGNYQASQNAFKQELSNLEVRFKVGEMPLAQYQRASKSISKKIQGLEEHATTCTRLLCAKSSADVAACLGLKPGSQAWGSFGGGIFSGLPGKEDFGTFVSSVGDAATPKSTLVGLAGGLMLIVSVVFFKWIAVPELTSFPSWDLSGWLPTVGVLGGLLAIGSCFLAEPRARGCVHLAMGAVALLSLPCIILMNYLASPSPQMNELHKTMGRAVWEAIRIREGFYFYLVAVAMLVGAGITQMRGKA